MPSSNRKNSVDIRGSELNTPKTIGHKETGTTLSAVSATSLTLESGVLVYNGAAQAIFVTHTGASGLADGDSQFTGTNAGKCFKLQIGEQVFVECDNLQDILVGQVSVLTGGTDTFSFEAH
tara:strand:- start:16 stop:378 length:363 start_codon:yes stop_codon:yes gene_type:complete